MNKIVKIMKKEYENSENVIDNRIFQHKNLCPRIEMAYVTKLLRAMANCRTDQELKVFWDKRAESYNRYKNFIYA